MKIIIPIFIFSFLVACFGKRPEKTKLDGTILPTFSLLLPDSTWFNTTNIPAGKASVLFQYSPHCPYCKQQMKDILANIDKLKDINFYLITLYPYQDMKKWNEEFKLSKYPNIITGADSASFAAQYFEATGVPYTAIYNRQKKFLQAFKGQVSIQQIIDVAQDSNN